MTITPEKLLAALKMKRKAADEDDHGLNLSVYHQYGKVYLLDGWVDLEQLCEELNR